jgi:hypothetical protein
MSNKIGAAGKSRKLVVQPDVVDLRDRYYTPSLLALPQEVKPREQELEVRDQGREGACTAFALASVIDRQCKQMSRDNSWPKVSTRMLYEMAKLHDDLPGERQSGSTLRGVLKGFFHNGVCLEADAPYLVAPGQPSFLLSLALAEAARSISLGAYYRLHHEINDYHTAINEAGAVIASAKIHSGWAKPRGGVIELKSRYEGRHAFAIVGYNTDGFIIQNSWSDRWSTYAGLRGLALWTYEDWYENVEDAWVLRLAISSPRAFSVKFARNHAALRDKETSASPLKPRRQDILGHFVHFDDGQLVQHGSYAQTSDAVQAIVNDLGDTKCRGRLGVGHLLLIAHGATQSSVAVAKRAKAWLPVFLENGVYPIHLMWETGFNNEVVDVIRDLLFKTRERMGEDAEHLDDRLEALARPLGTKLWRDLKTTASLFANPATESGKAIRAILAAARAGSEPLELHFLSQSAGVFLLAELADVLKEIDAGLGSASLLAPACSLSYYDHRIRPHVGSTISVIDQYSLIDHREKHDSLDVYGKSLLYLVSNGIEVEKGTALLGMQKFLEKSNDSPTRVKLPSNHKVFFAGKDRSVTDAKSHRTFDADRKTMNSIITRIAGQKAGDEHGFRKAHLSSYR